MNILLVDDEESTLEILCDVVTDQGHTPHPCLCAHAALDACENGYYPLVITDICMPDMNGLDLLGALKSSDRMRWSDIVICTGHGDMETAITALRRGAYDFLNKPVDSRELAALIERAAEHQALLRENKDFRERFDQKVREATHVLRKDLDTARQQLRSIAGVGDIVVESESMRRLLEDARTYHTRPESPVLIEGETGVGSNEQIEISKVIKMVLIHDIVEIDAGDVIVYDTQNRALAREKEHLAAERIFGVLPEDQKKEFIDLWNEFEERKTPESKFAAAIDRFEPILQNHLTDYYTWKTHGITHTQLHDKNQHIQDGSRIIWDVVGRIFNEAQEKGGC